jgi:hypothetical protein
MYARNVEIVHGPDGLQFVFPPGFAAGGFGFATTAHCLEETALPARAHYSGQGLWVMLRRFWSGWKRTLVIVQPDQSLVGIEPVSSCIGHGARGIKLARAGSA